MLNVLLNNFCCCKFGSEGITVKREEVFNFLARNVGTSTVEYLITVGNE